MHIREAHIQDFDNIWPIFNAIVSQAQTYTYSPNTTKEEAFELWINSALKTFVCEENNIVLGTYFIKANQSGNGSHVCNCGYMVHEKARGKGVASLMCKHSLKTAVELGFKAMQYNFVVSTNEVAIKLWEKHGFKIVGTLSKAFNHPQLSYVDAHIMYKWLD